MRTRYSTFFTGMFAMLMLGFLGFVGCVSPVDPDTYEVTTAPNSLSFKFDDAETQTATVTVSPSADWTFTPSEDWIKCEKDGGTLKVSVLKSDGTRREGSITITVSAKNSLKANTGTLTIIQEADPAGPVESKVNVTFDEAKGEYIGVSEAGYTGEYALVFTKEDRILTLVGFDELAPIPAKFTPAAGTYKSAEIHDFYTFAIGVLNNEKTIVGTKYQYGVREVMVKEGTFSLTTDGSTYTFSASMKGEDADYNQHEMEFSYSGKIPFTSSYEPEYIVLDGDVFASYYGDRHGDGFARNRVNITSMEDGEGYFHSFRSNYLYSKILDLDPTKEALYIPSATYKIREKKELYTMLSGYLNTTTSEIMNSYFSHSLDPGYPEEVTLAQYGSMTWEYKPGNKTYEIYGHIAGEDLKTKKINNIAFKYSGSFPVSNMNPSAEFKVNLQSTFMAYSASMYQNGLAYPGEYSDLNITIFDGDSNPNNTVSLNLFITLPLDYKYEKGTCPEGTFKVAVFGSPVLYSIVPSVKVGNALRHSHLSVSEKTLGYPLGYYGLTDGEVTIEKGSEAGFYKITGTLYGAENASGVVAEIKVDSHAKIR